MLTKCSPLCCLARHLRNNDLNGTIPDNMAFLFLEEVYVQAPLVATLAHL